MKSQTKQINKNQMVFAHYSKLFKIAQKLSSLQNNFLNGMAVVSY